MTSPAAWIFMERTAAQYCPRPAARRRRVQTRLPTLASARMAMIHRTSREGDEHGADQDAKKRTAYEKRVVRISQSPVRGREAITERRLLRPAKTARVLARGRRSRPVSVVSHRSFHRIGGTNQGRADYSRRSSAIRRRQDDPLPSVTKPTRRDGLGCVATGIGRYRACDSPVVTAT
jgi:hypothetical protein